MMTDFIIRAFNHLMFIELPDALKAEGVTARQRYWLLVVMIVRLEADAAFENLIHLLGSVSVS